MAQRSIPAAFMRGGTSKGLMLRAEDLPAERGAWAPLFAAMMGSPDGYGRQLDGMGGGVSSLSKVCVVAPSARPDADVDYTFAQVSIRAAGVDYAGNCGNMSSAVGPFALDEGWVSGSTAEGAVVRIFNTNTGKRIDARFPVEGGRARYDGDLVIPGVSGSGAAVRLDFIEPGGATTGRLLPTGRARDVLDVPGFGAVEASMVDAANAAVFVRAADLGLDGREAPDEIDGRADLLAHLEAIRAAASVAMGIAPDEATARGIRMVPFVCLVAPPGGDRADPGRDADLVLRAMSNGQAHRALPLTVSLCVAVAAQIQGSVVAECRRPSASGGTLKLAMPSGLLAV
ncbi:MAG: PrpF family protein, partial [Jatrophihabitans endophyticus]|nr:PrpF family protein [Jatrophihabitans endophyticus]